MTSNTFCKHLSNGYRFFIKDSKITWLPCCYWDGKEFPIGSIKTQRKIINVSTPWAHEECNKCKVEETYKSTNMRAAGNSIIPELPDSKAAWVDIQADITCNGGCLMCGPWSSSYWQSELAKYKEYKIVPAEKNLKVYVDAIFSVLDVSELRLLQFLGGEPFLSEVDEYAFAHITNPGICTLKYTTNGSIYPQASRIEQWKSFDRVSVNFSIDGIGKRFEYHRYPLSWRKVEDNINRLINEPLDHLEFRINHSITPLNVYYYDEFLDWVDRTFPKDRFKGIHTHTAYGVMSVANASEKLRSMVVEKYGAEHMLSKMLAANSYQNDTEFWNYINTWDERRSTNWRQTFPDIL